MKRIGITLALLIAGARLGGNWGDSDWSAANIPLWRLVHPEVVQAGHPLKCDPGGGVPCNMKSCAHLAKKQQWCSPKCHNGCCKCPTEGPNACNGHNPEQTPQPEEE